MCKKLICIVQLLYIITAAFSTASGQTGRGGTETPFSYGLQARTLAMGNAATAFPEGTGGLYWNPGGMVVNQQKNVGVSMTTLFAGTQYNYVGYVHPTLSSGIFGFGFARIGTGGIMHRDWDQNIVREYGEMDY